MSAGAAEPLRLLFMDPPADWRAVFDLVQAALALDLPVELGFEPPALAMLDLRDAAHGDCARAFASLRLLGLLAVRTPHSDAPPIAAPCLPLQVLERPLWRDWLRAGSLQVCR